MAGSQKLCAGDEKISVDKDLPRVENMHNFIRLLEKSSSAMPVREQLYNKADAKTAQTIVNEIKNEDSSSFSSTNIQVAGVDEADIVKTDGKYIYQVNTEGINIIKAVPADNMSLVSKIKFENPNFSPGEIYLEKDYLVVLGTNNYIAPYTIMPVPYAQPKIYPPHFNTISTKAIIYNIKERNNPQK